MLVVSRGCGVGVVVVLLFRDGSGGSLFAVDWSDGDGPGGDSSIWALEHLAIQFPARPDCCIWDVKLDEGVIHAGATLIPLDKDANDESDALKQFCDGHLVCVGREFGDEHGVGSQSVPQPTRPSRGGPFCGARTRTRTRNRNRT